MLLACFVAQDGFSLTVITLARLPRCWGYKRVPLCLTPFSFWSLEQAAEPEISCLEHTALPQPLPILPEEAEGCASLLIHF